MQKYAFVDRDGTLIQELGRDKQDVAFPPKNNEEVEFMSGAIDGLKLLQQSGYKLVLATNQSYLGTPRNPQDVFDAIMDYFYTELKNHGVEFTYTMICPHALEDNCACKKPKIGGLKHFLDETSDNIDLGNSLMFGDRETDREFAKNLGVKFVKVTTNGVFAVPDYIRRNSS